MAEESGQERSEEPTAKRLDDARKKGQIARSREFGTLVILIIGGGVLLAFGGTLGTRFTDLLASALVIERGFIYEHPTLLLPYVQALMGQALLTIAPLLAVLMVAALVAPILVGGFNFSTQALAPKFSKLNPISGLKRIVSLQGLMELIKAIGKFTLVVIVATLAIKSIWLQLLGLGEQPVEAAIARTIRLAGWLFVVAASALIAVAAIDVPYQIWNHKKQLKMSRQEIKDEFKETDGKPEVKGRIRQLQQEMARQRMMADVPKADVVVTNPTHFAVAIAYSSASMRAPRLLAKGADEVARAIREIAEEQRITRVEAPRVARAIYFTTDLGEEIPGGLFVAVARILAYVYQLKRADAESAPLPDPPEDLPVPDDYLDPHTAVRSRRQD